MVSRNFGCALEACQGNFRGFQGASGEISISFRGITALSESLQEILGTFQKEIRSLESRAWTPLKHP